MRNKLNMRKKAQEFYELDPEKMFPTFEKEQAIDTITRWLQSEFSSDEIQNLIVEHKLSDHIYYTLVGMYSHLVDKNKLSKYILIQLAKEMTHKWEVEGSPLSISPDIKELTKIDPALQKLLNKYTEDEIFDIASGRKEAIEEEVEQAKDVITRGIVSNRLSMRKFSQSTPETIQKAQAGDENAIAQVIEENTGLISQALINWGYIPKSDEFQDTMSDIKVEMLNRIIPQYNSSKGAFSTFLSTAVYNFLRRGTREKEYKEKQKEVSLAEPVEEGITIEDTLEDKTSEVVQMTLSSARENLQNWLHMNKPDFEEVVLRVFDLKVEEYSHERIAEALNQEGYTSKGRSFTRTMVNNYVNDWIKPALAQFFEAFKTAKLGMRKKAQLTKQLFFDFYGVSLLSDDYEIKNIIIQQVRDVYIEELTKLVYDLFLHKRDVLEIDSYFYENSGVKTVKNLSLEQLYELYKRIDPQFAEVVELLIQLMNTTDMNQSMILIDRINDMEHDTGSIFIYSSKIGDWINEALDIKVGATPQQLIPYLSKDVREAVIEYLRLTGQPISSEERSMSLSEKIEAAKDPNTPPEILTELAKGKDYEVLQEVAHHLNTPVEALTELAEKVLTGNIEFLGIMEIGEALLENSNLPRPLRKKLKLKGIREYPKSPNYEEAEDISTPPERLVELSKSKEKSIRSRAVTNPSLPPERLVELSKDKDVYIRRGVALNISTPPEVLTRLAKDKDDGVRYNVANNPSTPLKIKKQLKQIPNLFNLSMRKKIGDTTPLSYKKVMDIVMLVKDLQQIGLEILGLEELEELDKKLYNVFGDDIVSEKILTLDVEGDITTGDAIKIIGDYLTALDKSELELGSSAREILESLIKVCQDPFAPEHQIKKVPLKEVFKTEKEKEEVEEHEPEEKWKAEKKPLKVDQELSEETMEASPYAELLRKYSPDEIFDIASGRKEAIEEEVEQAKDVITRGIVANRLSMRKESNE